MHHRIIQFFQEILPVSWIPFFSVDYWILIAQIEIILYNTMFT